MCDTVVFVDNRRVLFAKNSDREVDEAQVLVWQSRKHYPEGEKLRCTYITIPQVRESYAILISKPSWMWGGEMGTNEFGVTIGNEAVFTNQPYRETGLTGMDLLRLALERSPNAKQACELIVQLLEMYGQGGNCGYRKNIYYHNSFLIADTCEAYVLETADKKYEIERVSYGCRAISNGLTIEKFKNRYGDRIKSYFTRCSRRKYLVEQSVPKEPTIKDMFRTLRLHKNGGVYPVYHWFYGGMDAPCMHAGGLFLNYQTTASWVAELMPGRCSHWVTATSTPCISIFKPVDVFKPLNNRFCNDNNELIDTFWWAHEKFQRLVMKNPQNRVPIITKEISHIENEWLKNPPETELAFSKHEKLIRQWSVYFEKMKIRDTRPVWSRYFWKKYG